MKRVLPKLNLNPKIVNALFWVGLGLMIAGLSAGTVAGNLSPVAIALVMGGLMAVVLWLALRWLNAPETGSPWWRQRSVQTGTNALLTTLAVAVILGGINFLAVRAPGQIDFTEAKQFSLAPQTEKVLKDLKQPVKVLVFTNQPDAQQRSLLELYKRQNPDRFDFEFIDPQAQPGLAQKYKIRNLGETVLETGDRTKSLEGGMTEPDLTPAIASFLRDRKVNAYLLQGHDETPINGGKGNLDEAVTELKKRDFNVSVLNLLEQKQIPEDTNVLIISGPKREYLPAEVKLLQDYLNQGKSLLLMLDPGEKNGLDPILKDWGVQLDGRIVVDASGSGQLLGLGPAVPLVLQYGEHPITKDFAQGPSFYPLAQAVTVKPPSSNEQSTDLLTTNPQSWAEGDPKQEELKFNPDRDRQGPLTIGVAITRTLKTESASGKETKEKTKADQTAKKEAKMVVIGDSDFATSGPFSKGLNGDVFLNAVTWLGSGQDDPNLSIRAKTVTDRRVEMTPTNWRILILAALGLPAAAFGSAAYLWWKRR
ncbi:MAG: Gldg family protein [Thermosynechococcaceae cyanobacterium]